MANICAHFEDLCSSMCRAQKEEEGGPPEGADSERQTEEETVEAREGSS